MKKISQKLGSWKRKFNLHVVTYFSTIDLVLKKITLLFSLISIIAIFFYHGFYLSEQIVNIIDAVINVIVIFYLVKYFIYSIYSVKRTKYLKEHVIWGVLLLFLIFNFFIIPKFSSNLDLFAINDLFHNYYSFFLQFFLIIISISEIAKSTTFISRLNLSPSGLMLFSFVSLITLGTILLMMPRMTTSPISFVDALFTTTSASCVTGLAVLNTGVDFTLRGQVVIMTLIQLGGINILAFATFFTTIFSRNGGITLQQSHLLKGIMDSKKTSDSVLMFKEVIIATLIIEFFGTLLLFLHWQNAGIFPTTTHTFYQALFHTISAFNNAGFSLWNDSLANPLVARSYFPQFVIMVLIVLGGLGFFVLRDIFSPQTRRDRKKYPWKQWAPSTYIVLYTTAFIIGIGTLCFFLFEYNFSLSNLPIVERVFASLFQVVTSRTAGFNTIDFTMLTIPTILLIIIIMFIGASPGSTGGGIKITTAFVIFKTILATIKGYRRVEFRKKTIPLEIASKSYSIVVMSIIIVFLSIIALSLTDRSFSLTQIIFESVSAFSTTGLSLGITSSLSELGKLILVFNMLIGRIGTLSIAFALSRRTVAKTIHQYPATYFMVG